MTYKILEVNVDDRGRSGVYSLVTSVIKNKPKEIDISGITAQYNIKVEDKYISGMEHGFDLDKKYDNFTKISKTSLEKINLLIIETLDTYTKLKTS